MTDLQKRRVGNAGKIVSSIDGVAALREMVEAVRECITTHEVESTKRSTLEAYEHTEVARIRAAESILKDYFARVFAERREVYAELFDRMDRALDTGDSGLLHEMVSGVVDVAKSSPLAAVGDLSQIRAALSDPNQVWEL